MEEALNLSSDRLLDDDDDGEAIFWVKNRSFLVFNSGGLLVFRSEVP